MVDMRKEFPSQTENRRQWILDVVRENQDNISELLRLLTLFPLSPNTNVAFRRMDIAQMIIDEMKPMDRDAILQPNGILTDSQIEMLK